MIDFDSDDFKKKALVAKNETKTRVILPCQALCDGWVRAYDKHSNESIVYLKADTEEIDADGKYYYKVSKTCPAQKDADAIATNEEYINWYNTAKWYTDKIPCGRWYKDKNGHWVVALADKITSSGWIWMLSWTSEPELVYVIKPSKEPPFEQKRGWYLYLYNAADKHDKVALYADTPENHPKKLVDHPRPAKSKASGCLTAIIAATIVLGLIFLALKL